ncbi:codanin-1-like isoform X8 [Acipenser ruthenus]|uniref:codanin-1-like isoform X8 n=1 Tax=Acipenser ruthenus TaxID=7906 RepID=UPI0027403F02|nr:codanin-1-like isoform X8 [Acipenser ruthenus]
MIEYIDYNLTEKYIVLFVYCTLVTPASVCPPVRCALPNSVNAACGVRAARARCRMAALLESVLREEVEASRAVHWIKNVQLENGSCDSLAQFSVLRRDFVPFLLNFLREQASQILANGPSTPAKTPSSKGQRTPGYPNERSGVSQSGRAPPKGASRVQLFSPPPCSPAQPEFDTPGTQYLSGITFLSSPSFTASPAPRRSDQRASLGEFLPSPDPQPPQRRGRRRGGPTSSGGRQPGREAGRGLNEEPGRWDRGGRTETSITPPPPQLNINNLEDFPPVGATPTPAGKTKPSRRINPTPVSAERPQSKPKNCFTSTPLSQPPPSPAIPESPGAGPDCWLQEEREMLRRERCVQAPASSATPALRLACTKMMCPFQSRAKLSQQTSSLGLPPALEPSTPTKLGSSRTSASGSADRLSPTADLHKVSTSCQLDLLAELHCACIAENLVPNVFLELFFVLQLLTSRGSAPSEERQGGPAVCRDVLDRPYFNSVHNCVYFAVKVLENNFDLISQLDKCTLRLLAENERLGSFSPALRDRLLAAHESSTAKVSRITPSFIQSVPFQPATDNRSNFCSDKAFHIFKKQRDIFYELLREWEDFHKEPGWVFDMVLGSRVRGMVSQLTAASNHSHFARLFQKQLIQMCKGTGGEAPDLDVLGMLGADNLSRLKRLQERFIQPQSIMGPCPPPSFPGHQEFFRDFLLTAGSYQLNQHLMDSLCQQILELDSICILGPGSSKEEGEGDVEQQGEKQRFCSVLTTARLLAKFLGFITFLPYQTREPPARGVQEAAIGVRNKSAPVLDVCEVLRQSMVKQRTVLTVPWLVEFLSMVDHTAPYLLHYRRVFTLLLQLYRRTLLGTDREGRFLNQLLIVAVLGWLFQIPAVPEDLFFSGDFRDETDVIETPAPTQGLDCLPLVDQQLLYICCPYLSEFRKLLAAFVAGSAAKNGGLIRKITPTAAEPLESPAPLSQQKLQAELEQAFFHNQPQSLRRTVEFVAERVGSNSVKHIKATLVSELVQSGEAQLQGRLRDEKASVARLFDSVCTQLCERGRQTLSRAREFCSVKSPEAIRILLPEETSAAVLSTAEDIAVRLATEKACTWLSANIAALIKRELKAAFDRMMKSLPPPPVGALSEGETPREPPEHTASRLEEKGASCPPGCEHKATLPSDLIIEIKEVLSVTLGPRSQEERVGFQQIQDLLQRLGETLCCRKFIFPVPEQMLARCSVGLACVLVSGQLPLSEPELPAEEGSARGSPVRALLDQLLGLWRHVFRTPVPLQLLFTDKHLASILEAGHTQWEEFLFLVSELQGRGLLGAEEVQSSWKSLSALSWPTVSALRPGLRPHSTPEPYTASAPRPAHSTPEPYTDFMEQINRAACRLQQEQYQGVPLQNSD